MIEVLPEVLTIHLKRFRHEPLFSSKISSHISFPIRGLDMKPWLTRGKMHFHLNQKEHVSQMILLHRLFL